MHFININVNAKNGENFKTLSSRTDYTTLLATSFRLEVNLIKT